jgi:hypothetical protein
LQAPHVGIARARERPCEGEHYCKDSLGQAAHGAR